MAFLDVLLWLAALVVQELGEEVVQHQEQGPWLPCRRCSCGWEDRCVFLWVRCVCFCVFLSVGLIAPHCSNSELAMSFSVSWRSVLLFLKLLLRPCLVSLFLPLAESSQPSSFPNLLLLVICPDRRFPASIAGGADDEWRGSNFTRREPTTVKKSKTGEELAKASSLLSRQTHFWIIPFAVACWFREVLKEEQWALEARKNWPWRRWSYS